MKSLYSIGYLLKKDIMLEWRQRYTLYGVILYICSSVFAIKMLEDKPDGVTWNVLFWIMMLFISVNAIAKSFLLESKNRNLYYFSVHHPREVILAKLIYNKIMMLFFTTITLLIFAFLLGFPTEQYGAFILMAFTGGVSISLLFTTVSAIAGKAGGNAALIAILGFPLVIPELIILSDLSKPFFDDLSVTGWWSFMGALLLLDVVVVILSYVLFPFIWHE